MGENVCFSFDMGEPVSTGDSLLIVRRELARGGRLRGEGGEERNEAVSVLVLSWEAAGALPERRQKPGYEHDCLSDATEGGKNAVRPNRPTSDFALERVPSAIGGRHRQRGQHPE